MWTSDGPSMWARDSVGKRWGNYEEKLKGDKKNAMGQIFKDSEIVCMYSALLFICIYSGHDCGMFSCRSSLLEKCGPNKTSSMVLCVNPNTTDSNNQRERPNLCIEFKVFLPFHDFNNRSRAPTGLFWQH